MKTPKSLDLEITNRCNLRCTYCSHFESKGDVDEEVRTEEWISFFEELTRNAVTEVCLQGGEPFIREDFETLLKGIVRNRMRFSILSNGTLITDEMAAFIASTGRCNSVQVSIDGSIETTHDAFRGKGSFFKAVRGLKLLLKHKVPATVRVTIHKKNVRELEAVTALLLDEIGLPGFSTNAASYLGLCRQNAGQVQLTTDDRSLAMESLLKLSKKYPGRISAQAGPLAEARSWIRMKEALEKGLPAFPNGGRLTGCSGPATNMAIRADGAMILCGQLPGIVLGQINRDDLKEIWQNHPEIKQFRERKKIPLSNFEYCENCPYAPYCTGGCPAIANTLLKDPYAPTPDACLKRFLEEGGRIPIKEQ